MHVHTFYKKYQISHLPNMESVYLSYKKQQITCLLFPAGTYLDYDNTNINVLFVDPLFILMDEICVGLRVFC